MNESPKGSAQPADQGPGSADHPEQSAEERELLADQREAALDTRESRIEVQEGVQADRKEEAERVLADADLRDDQADARDSLAERRDMAASLESFLHDNDFGPGVEARRSTALDRSDSKRDRTHSAADRTKLTEDPPSQVGTEQD